MQVAGWGAYTDPPKILPEEPIILCMYAALDSQVGIFTSAMSNADVKCRPNLVTFVDFINYKLVKKTP